MLNFFFCMSAGFFALFWTKMARKQLTVLSTVLLAISSLLCLVGFWGIDSYAPYLFAFFSVFATIESQNSLRFSQFTKFFFFISGILMAFFAVFNLFTLPFSIPQFPFAIAYIALLGVVYFKFKKEIYTRMGILIVWLAEAITWI